MLGGCTLSWCGRRLSRTFFSSSEMSTSQNKTRYISTSQNKRETHGFEIRTGHGTAWHRVTWMGSTDLGAMRRRVVGGLTITADNLFWTHQ